jgi:hypothetical protein
MPLLDLLVITTTSSCHLLSVVESQFIEDSPVTHVNLESISEIRSHGTQIAKGKN